jgi:hypothetical protein
MEEMKRIGNGKDLNSLYPNIRELKKKGLLCNKEHSEIL